MGIVKETLPASPRRSAFGVQSSEFTIVCAPHTQSFASSYFESSLFTNPRMSPNMDSLLNGKEE
jgi:hypothetical protein